MGLAGFGQGFEAKQIGRPIPDIAGHAMEPVAIGGKRARRAGESIAIGGGVLSGKIALPDIAGQMRAIIGRRIAPRIGHIPQTATRGMLPFRFTWKTSPRPSAIGLRIRPRQMNRRVIGQAFGAQRACGISPIGAIDPPPPLSASRALHRGLGRGNLEVKDKRPAENLSFCYITGLFCKMGKLRIAHRGLPQQEWFQLDSALRRLAV